METAEAEQTDAEIIEDVKPSEIDTNAYKASEALKLDNIKAETSSTLTLTSQKYVNTSKTLGLYNFNKQVDNSKYCDNKVTVAVIDSGLTYTTNPVHEIGKTLCNKIKHEWCCAFGGTADAGDKTGHGTAVSSLIAYHTPSNVKYCMFKVMDSNNNIERASIYAAFEQAYVYDIDVVNMSIATTYALGNEYYREYDAILSKLYEKGVIVCCAAGNDANHKIVHDANGNVTSEFDTSANCVSPANSSYALCISALDAATSGLYPKADYTNTGNTVDYSTIGSNVLVYTKDSGVAAGYGTSYACPIVAAEFAVFKTCSDSFKTVSELRALYDLYLTPESKAADSNIYGRGYIDLSNYTLCTANHSKCCGLWHYDGTSADIGVPHYLNIDMNGGTGYGYTDLSTQGWASKFSRIFTCGYECHFASAYSYETSNPNGWIQFGEGQTTGGGSSQDPYTPYRKNYVFTGWKCSGIGSVHKKISYLGNRYTEVWCYDGEDNGDVTLTAQWMPKKLYSTLTVDPNGGTMFRGSVANSSSFDINYKISTMNDDYRILCDSNTPTCYNGKAIGEPIRNGYTFAGWKVTNGSGAVEKIIDKDAYFTNEFYGKCSSTYAYAFQSKARNTTIATVKAQWTPNKYRVDMVFDGGSTIASGKVTFGETYGNLLNYKPTKTGYTFDGWYTQPTGGRKITTDTKMTIASDHKLYAHLKAK